MFKKLFCVSLFFFGGAGTLLAQEAYQAHTHIQLISEQNTIASGSTFWVGLKLVPDEGWHTYWRNPGDAGLSPKIKWDLPSGIKAGDIQWPYPQRLNAGPLTNFGYEHQVFLLIPISLDAGFPLGDISLHAKAYWLTCDKEECVPGQADLNLPMAVVKDASAVSFNNLKNVFDQTRLNIPQEMPTISSHVFLDGDQWHLTIEALPNAPGDVIFYPFRDDVIEHAAPQNTQTTDSGYQLTLTKSHLYQGNANSLEGIAVHESGWGGKGQTKAIIIHAPVESAPAAQTPAAAPTPALISFGLACLFALIGGLTLNLMPCVLPVLSIKVLHLVERHPDKNKAIIHSLVYSSGILVSVWVLALLLFILKSAGKFAGWGFQFQSPFFVAVVAVILFVLALNLFGVFEFSLPAMTGVKSPQQGLHASFISGVITTIVASPCTAPFMGTALTVGLSQPNIIGFGIFTSLGIGLALPFIVLSAFPSLLSFVPKPGLWMVRLKQVLGIVLLACVLWLGWVWGIETGLWDLSKFSNSPTGIQWQSYSPEAMAQARVQGHGVFLDFTAAWCINCQVNDRLVLQNQKVVEAFKGRGIVAFKGDWTKYDPAITRALAGFGRNSIPVYVYYPPGSNTPEILPQVITPEMIVQRIENNQ